MYLSLFHFGKESPLRSHQCKEPIFERKKPYFLYPDTSWYILVSRFAFIWKVWFGPRKQQCMKRNRDEYETDDEELLLKHFTYWTYCDSGLSFLAESPFFASIEFKYPNANFSLSFFISLLSSYILPTGFNSLE